MLARDWGVVEQIGLIEAYPLLQRWAAILGHVELGRGEGPLERRAQGEALMASIAEPSVGRDIPRSDTDASANARLYRSEAAVFKRRRGARRGGR